MSAMSRVIRSMFCAPAGATRSQPAQRAAQRPAGARAQACRAHVVDGWQIAGGAERVQ